MFGASDEYLYTGNLKKEDFQINDAKLLDDVQVSLSLRKIENEVFVKGCFVTKLEQQCVKCLESFQELIEDEFELIYLPESLYEEYEESFKNEHEYNINEVLREKLENGFIDVLKIITEYIMVAMPEYPKCSQECHGIQEIDKYTKENEMDPRWEQLLNIVKEK